MPTRFMNKSGVEAAGGFAHGMHGADGGDQRFLMGKPKRVVFGDVTGEEDGVKNSGSFKGGSCSEDSSSSIGKNSDLSENSVEKCGDDEEVESSYKGPLDAMEALEEVLPIRRGISRFYNGKSKSFASLADVSLASSVKDIAKPDNAYIRKRRNLVACSLGGGPSLRGNSGGISKRSSKTTLALAVAMRNSEADTHNSNGSLPHIRSLKNLSPWRSFSLADLQQCASVAIACSNSDELITKPA